MKNQIFTFSMFTGIVVSWLLLGACGTQKAKHKSEELKPYTGSYESVQGVKNPLSCFCYAAGYLSLESGERIALCFDENAKIENCKEMTIWGKFETKTIELSPENPCSKESRTVFLVNKFECR